MKAIQIADGIHWIGANISTNDLFEGIWPIPDGVTLNAYVVKGEKLALIDLVRDWGGATHYLESQLMSIGLTIKDVDYLILNHLEPDHTGWLRILIEMNPKIEIYTTEKGTKLVNSFYKITENLKAVKSGDTLDLGAGKQLVFQEVPNVHWPETMVTYESSEKVLFSCDAFGAFGALQGSIFDDEVPKAYYDYYDSEMLRYYANIVGPFSNFVLKAIDKLAGIEIKVVAPSHGLVWRNNPAKIINAYKRLAGYMSDFAEPKITVVWGTMYGNTEVMVREILRGIASEGVPVKVYKVPENNVSYIQASAWESAGLVIAMPTYEYKMFPPMRYVLDIFAQKHVWHKKVLRFGSYGWVGGAEKEFEEKVASLKWDLMDPIEFAGAPDDEILTLAYNKGKELAQQVKAIPTKKDSTNS